MLFLDIQRDVWSRLNKPNPPDPQTQARIKSFINQRHRTLLTMPGLNQLRQDTIEVTNVFDEPVITLPAIVNRVDAVVDQLNNRRLTEKPLEWLRTANPRYDRGTPTVYIARGYQSEQFRPGQAGEIWLYSSQPEDTGVIRIEGLRPHSILQRIAAVVTATMQGTTLMQVSGIPDWIQISKIFVSQPAAGFINIVLAHSPGPVIQETLAIIEPGRVRPYVFAIQLWPKPSAIYTYLIDYTRTITDLVEDTDQPLLPEDFHDLLAIGARVDEYEKVDDQRRQTAVREWNERYAALQYFLQGRQSSRIIPYGMKGGRTGWNNVNSWAAPDFYL